MTSEPDRLIREVLNIKRGDTLPYTPYHSKTTRNDFARIFAALGYTKGAEIGVAQGRYSEVLCQGIPNLQLMCVDPWQAYERVSQRLCDERYAEFVAKLAPYPVRVVRKPSMAAVQDVPPESLDFIYIDGAHDFDNVMMDLIEWAKRVHRGGIISGHDYFSFYQSGVVRAVDAYVLAHGINSWYVTREMMPSFLWVKP